MSDQQSFQEKTEKPTPKKREEAKKEGQVPRSQELTTAIMLLAAAGVVTLGAGSIGSALMETFRGIMSAAASPPETVEGMNQLLNAAGKTVVAALMPVLLGLMGVALVVAGVQARGVLSGKPLQPKLERILPHKNIKRLYGVKPWADLAKSLLKLGVIAAVLYPILSTALRHVGDLAMKSTPSLVVEIQSRGTRLLLAAGLAYLIVALADYAYQIWQHERQLKMTKEEVKRERKEQEGDMMIKARRRSIGRELARQRMFNAVPDADVVVTNPTHVAVALRYRPEESLAPVIVAMGERKVAQRIKALALDEGVPIMENKPLARALLATGTVGQPIPGALYVAVAEVLAFVIRQRKASGLSEVV